MAEQILPWVGLVVLFTLCLPIRLVRTFVLIASSWTLRIAVVAALGAGVYLWFQPGDFPATATAVLRDLPGVMSQLPALGSSAFGLCLACLVVVPLVPVLAVIDAVRLLRPAGSVVAAAPAPKPRAERIVEDVEDVQPVEVFPEAQEIEEPIPVGVPIMRPIERRDAAGAIATAGSRRTT